MFRHKQKAHFQTVYKRDAETGAYIIEVDLDKYADVFNEWDRGPMRRRDIDPDFLLFIQTCSEDIPLRFPLALCFYLPEDKRNPRREEWISAGLGNYFAFELDTISKELRRNHRRVLFHVVSAFAFLLTAYGFEPAFGESLVLRVLAEGLIIGGWVFLWEAISVFFFSNREVRERRRRAERFQGAAISFRYE